MSSGMNESNVGESRDMFGASSADADLLGGDSSKPLVILLIQKNEVIQDFYNVFRFLEKKANSRNAALKISFILGMEMQK